MRRQLQLCSKRPQGVPRLPRTLAVRRLVCGKEGGAGEGEGEAMEAAEGRGGHADVISIPSFPCAARPAPVLIAGSAGARARPPKPGSADEKGKKATGGQDSTGASSASTSSISDDDGKAAGRKHKRRHRHHHHHHHRHHKRKEGSKKV